ncbi:MAG TPA: putative sulfate exporter family transporter, partial [Bradyrhizobium sp.]|nr:putative sulfate exporter family transporter [Bradyrhizobium sp.]
MPAIKQPDPIAKAFGARVAALLPGIALSVLISVVSLGIQYVEERIFGHPYLEGLVMAILIGIVVRTFWQPGSRWRPGIAFSAKQLLETAVVLLGATITFAAIAASGLSLIAAILTTVCVILGASYGISRLLGLSVRLSILVACGNSICGNSAIAAVAPVIGANGDDIVSSISFTAVLGVVVVLGLPLLVPLLALSPSQYGILAGLTVYAVPQVL